MLLGPAVMSCLNMLLGPALELGKEFIKGKADEKKAIQERKINAIQNDADWENKMADATSNSVGKMNSGQSSCSSNRCCSI
jgi:hypothetical protein